MTLKEKQELLQLLETKEQIRLANERKNTIYEMLDRFKGRYVVLMGGSGSGKSYAVADKIIDRARIEPKARILGVRAERTQVSESQYPLLWSRTQFTSGWNTNKAKGSEKVYSKKGGEILFSGLDDVTKLKSIFDITSVWVEEADQVQETDISELDRRLRGYAGLMQIYFTLNPVSSLSYIKRKFFDDRKKEYTIKEDGAAVKKIFDRTITLRGVRPFEDFPCYKDTTVSDDMLTRTLDVWSEEKKQWTTELYYNTLIIHSTYLDNKFIDDDYYKVMERLKIDDIDEYNIYALGLWGIMGGTYFDKGNVSKRIQDAPIPIKTGYFDYTYESHEILDDTIKWVDDTDGYIKLFELPKKNYPYVLGGDTAGEGSDYNTGCLTDNTTGIDVASVKINYDEDLYARQMYCLGKYYGELSECRNNALIGLEVNFSTHPTKELERLRYNNLYVREQAPDAFTGVLTKKFGFRTTGTAGGGGTRPTILGMLRTIVREEPHKIKDIDTLNEMTTFVKNEKGKPCAANGYHDDMIMARAINCYISDQQVRTVKHIQRFSLAKLPKDLQEDYLGATKDGKAYLKSKWTKIGLFD